MIAKPSSYFLRMRYTNFEVTAVFAANVFLEHKSTNTNYSMQICDIKICIAYEPGLRQAEILC